MPSRKAWTPSAKRWPTMARSSSPAAWAPRQGVAGTGGNGWCVTVHPKVLAVTGPHATQEVMDAVHLHVPKPHDPFVDLVPEARAEFRGVAGIKLTPRHYAYLKISEGCNHRCTFCIIPSMRGDLVSRPGGRRAERGARAVRKRREGAAGRQPGHQRLRRGRQVPHRLLGRQAGARLACSSCATQLGDAGRGRMAPGCGCTTCTRTRTWTKCCR